MYDYANFTQTVNRQAQDSIVGTPMSTISRMLPGKRMFQDEVSPMHMNFLNTPIRTRNQYKIESRG